MGHTTLSPRPPRPAGCVPAPAPPVGVRTASAVAGCVLTGGADETVDNEAVAEAAVWGRRVDSFTFITSVPGREQGSF